MKIEVIGIRTNESRKSGIQRVSLVIRVPRDIKYIDLKTVKSILNEREERITKLNEYRKLKGREKLSNIPGIKSPERKEDSISFLIVSWFPVMSADKLEILQKYL